MANQYKWNINPFQDFLLASLMYDADISDTDLEVDIYIAFNSILGYLLNDSKEIELLDFEIKKIIINLKLLVKI
jgi:hypothetical protein